MEQPELPPDSENLESRGVDEPREPARWIPPAGLSCFLGVMAGTAMSVAAWIPAWNQFPAHGHALIWAIILVPLVKFIIYALFHEEPGGRWFANGIIISILTGALVFFGNCANSFLH